MSTTKQFKIQITAEKQTDPIKQVVAEFSDLRSILLLVNMPFRAYHTAIRLATTFTGAFAGASAASVGPITAESAAVGGQAASIIALNEQLRELIVLQAAATQGASLAGAAAGASGAVGLLGAVRGGVAAIGAVPSAQEAGSGLGIVRMGGAAIVHEGETIGQGGGMGFGGGDVNVNIAGVSLDPAGMSLSDFASQLGEEIRSALRGLTRNIPS